MRVAREGIVIIAIFALVSALLGWAGVHFLGVFGWLIVLVDVVLTGWCVWFFRDPDRSAPRDPGVIISPADGVVVAITKAQLPAELGGRPDSPTMLRVCVFMNVFNVHVNRVPCSGVIRKLSYSTGKFFNASLDKASTHNERMAVLLETGPGALVAFVQIAGLVARRIVCRLREGQAVSIGERFGLIRFGSRVDVYVPSECRVLAAIGQKTVAGETVLARFTTENHAGSGATSAVELGSLVPSVGAAHAR